MKRQKRTIVFSGGGTLGSVTPLLALKELLEKEMPDVQFVWVGTKHGPERAMAEHSGMPFVAIHSGKWRRYVSLRNVSDVFLILLGFFQAFWFLLRRRPALCISAGGFVSVPLHWAACLLRVPAWVHQQDVRVGLSTRLMAPCARIITTALAQTKTHFPKQTSRVHHIGNPVRALVQKGSEEQARAIFGLTVDLPVVLVMGGGTGARALNEMVFDALPALNGVCQVIHLTGKNRGFEQAQTLSKTYPWYHPHEFVTVELPHAYAAASVVVMRGGFGSWSELAAVQKPVIVVPKPGHQEENMQYFVEKDAAVLILEDKKGDALAQEIRALLEDGARRASLARNLHAALPATDYSSIKMLIP